MSISPIYACWKRRLLKHISGKIIIYCEWTVGFKIVSVSNGDFFSRSMPTAVTKCVNLGRQVRARCPKSGHTTLSNFFYIAYCKHFPVAHRSIIY